MSQTKRSSFKEALLNVVVGYLVALGCQLVVYPLYNIHISLYSNMTLTFIFTTISLLRSYSIRRLFNRKEFGRIVMPIRKMDFWDTSPRFPNRKKRQTYGRNYKKVVPRKVIPQHEKEVEGTEEQILEAYNLASEYQVKLLDFADREDIPKEIFDFQRRYLHFAKKGPRKGYFITDGVSKLTQADVLYILSCKISSKFVAEKFNTSERTIKKIRAGDSKDWREEYLLVRRLRKAIHSRHKKNYLGTYATLIIDASGRNKEIIAITSSIKRAKEFRKTWLKYNKKLSDETIKDMNKTKLLDIMYPIVEKQMIL